jgi:superfamily II DNA or RNA helicase
LGDSVIKLFDYQEELVEGAIACWRQGYRRIAMVMATGGGKTPTFSRLAGMCAESGRGVLVLAHRTELIDQAIDKLEQVNPGIRIGRLQGTKKEYRAPVVVGSVATAATATTLALLRARQWGLIIVDETHHIVAETYMRILRELGAFEPDGPLVLGVTATLGRADRKALGDVFEAVIEPQIGLLDLIRRGRLVRPRGIRVRIADLDLSRVKTVAGDLGQRQLGAAMSAAMAPARLIEAWTEHAKGRPTMAFMPSIDISKEVVEAFRAAGVAAVHLDGTTPDDVREKALDDFRAGRITLISNVGLFTEGTDLPIIECVILKMTTSGLLYQQMVGRGLRLYPGKKDCVILDPTGVTGRHKLATMVNLNGPGDIEVDEVPDDLLMYEEDLAEAEAEPAEDVGAEHPEYADGDLDHELFDLFAESHSAWLRTAGGVWFLPTPEGFIYLAPRPHDRYDLCWFLEPARFRRNTAERGVIQADMEIGYAMAAGDEYVARVPYWQNSRDAEWRRDPDRASRSDANAKRRASAALDTRA